MDDCVLNSITMDKASSSQDYLFRFMRHQLGINHNDLPKELTGDVCVGLRVFRYTLRRTTPLMHDCE